MLLPRDAFSKSISADIKDHIVWIRNRNNSIFKCVTYFLGVFLLIFWIYKQGLNTGALFLLAVLVMISYLAYRDLRFSTYTITVLDLKQRSVLRKSLFAFVNPKKYLFTDLKGVSLNTQAVGGYASAYEDETTDFEKTVVLETDTGEIPLLNYVSREEETEESLSKFTGMMQELLTQTSVS
jgi:hypothetical protein